VADHRVDPVLSESRRVGRLSSVGSRHLRAECARHERETTHARAADPDEMKPAASPVKCVHAARIAINRGRRADDRNLVMWRATRIWACAAAIAVIMTIVILIITTIQFMGSRAWVKQ